MTGRLCEVRKESLWQSRSQLGQCWPTVRKITGINTQRPALNNKTSDWKVFLRPIRVLWLIFPDVCLLIVRHLWASQWAPCLFGWHYSSCRPRSMDFFFFFFLFDTSFHSATALHHRKSSSLLGGYLKIIMFRLLSFMCYTPSFLSIFYKVKLFNIEMSESTEMSFL